MKYAVRLTATLCALVLPGLARAGGYAYPDQGTVAMGRGSAFAAKADDGTALYYNPAGFAQQEGWQVMVDLTSGIQNTSFQRTDATGADIGPSVSNAPGAFFVPFVTVSKGFNLGLAGKLTLAVGIFSPAANGTLSFPDETPPNIHGGQATFPFATCGLSAPAPPSCAGAGTSSLNTAPQKYQFINDNIAIAYPSIAVGYAPFSWIAVGGSLQLVYANTQFRRATYDGSLAEQASQSPGIMPNPNWVHQPSNEQLSYDTMANVAVTGATLTGNVGLRIKPLPFLTIGASYKPKATLTQSGTLKLDFSPLAQSTQDQATGPGTSNTSDGLHGQGPTTLTNTFPGELKTGIDYDFGIGDIELDFHITQWGAYTEALLVPEFSQKNITIPNPAPIPPVHLTRNMSDTWSLRLGGEVRIPLPAVRLAVRAGVGYESDPYNNSSDPNHPQYVTVDYANFDQYWGSVGATVGLGSFDLDVAYSHVYQPEHDVRNSGTVAVQNNPTVPSQPVVVGNGNYSTAYDLLALGGRVHF